MFQLSKEDVDFLRSQIVTLNKRRGNLAPPSDRQRHGEEGLTTLCDIIGARAD